MYSFWIQSLLTAFLGVEACREWIGSEHRAVVELPGWKFLNSTCTALNGLGLDLGQPAESFVPRQATSFQPTSTRALPIPSK